MSPHYYTNMWPHSAIPHSRPISCPNSFLHSIDIIQLELWGANVPLLLAHAEGWGPVGPYWRPLAPT